MRLSIAALTLTVLLAAAPAAQAADVSLSDTGELRVTDADGVANDIRVWRNAGIAVADNAAPLNLAAGSCTVVSIHFVSCPEAAVTRIVVHAGGGDDTITPSGSLGGRTTELYGDEGDDKLVAAGDGATFDGGAGDDTFTESLPGIGATADDTVVGGPGFDLRLDPAPADCEGALAQFTGPAVISGRSVVGSTLTVTAPVDGTPEPTVDTVWWSCFDVCEEVGTGPRYTTTADDVDHDIS